MISCTRSLVSLSLSSSSSLSGSARVGTGRAISRLCSLIVCFSSSVSCCSSRWLLVIGLGRVVRSCWCSSSVAVIVSLSYGTRVSSCIRCSGRGGGRGCLIGLIAGRGGGRRSLGVRCSGRRRGYRVSRLPGLICGGAGRLRVLSATLRDAGGRWSVNSAARELAPRVRAGRGASDTRTACAGKGSSSPTRVRGVRLRAYNTRDGRARLFAGLYGVPEGASRAPTR